MPSDLPKDMTFEHTPGGFVFTWPGELRPTSVVFLLGGPLIGFLLFFAGWVVPALAIGGPMFLVGASLLVGDLERNVLRVSETLITASGGGAARNASVDLHSMRHVFAYQEDVKDDEGQVVTEWSLAAVSTRGERVPLFTRLPGGDHARLLERTVGSWLTSLQTQSPAVTPVERADQHG